MPKIMEAIPTAMMDTGFLTKVINPRANNPPKVMETMISRMLLKFR